MTADTLTHQPSVLSKARHILDAFLDADLGVTAVLPLTEPARRSGVPKASVHRLCQELLEWGLLERAAPGTGYRLGLLLFEMGQRVSRQRLLRDAAMGPMEELVAATGATVHLGIRAGLDVLYVEKLPGRRPVAEPSTVAGRLPLHATATATATATAKVLLAAAPRRCSTRRCGPGSRASPPGRSPPPPCRAGSSSGSGGRGSPSRSRSAGWDTRAWPCRSPTARPSSRRCR
jgi:DNA-binding IclR family transcriptional regulator